MLLRSVLNIGTSALQTRNGLSCRFLESLGAALQRQGGLLLLVVPRRDVLLSELLLRGEHGAGIGRGVGRGGFVLGAEPGEFGE